MNVTTKVPSESSALAHVNFKVRGEKLGYGETIYLIQEGDTKMQKVCILVTWCGATRFTVCSPTHILSHVSSL